MLLVATGGVWGNVTPRINPDGTVTILGPYCPEDNGRLKYKQRRLFSRRPAPPPTTTPAAFGTRSRFASVGDMLAGLEGSAANDKEDPEWEIRDLSGSDRTGEESGPYCDDCGRFRRMPKTVDECRLDVLAEVRAELHM